MKNKALLTAAAVAASLLSIAAPSAAMADPVCSDGSTNGNISGSDYVGDAVFDLSDFCTESSSLTILGTDWSYGGSYNATNGTVFSLIYGVSENITVYVTDGTTNQQFVMTVTRY